MSLLRSRRGSAGRCGRSRGRLGGSRGRSGSGRLGGSGRRSRRAADGRLSRRSRRRRCRRARSGGRSDRWGAASTLRIRSRNRRRNRCRLDEDPTPIPIFRSSVRTTVGQPQFTDMPILRIRRCGDGHGRDDLDQGVTPGRLPQPDGARAEVDVVREVIPRVWCELRAPFGHLVDVPAEGVVCDARCTTDEAVFDLREVALPIERSIFQRSHPDM